MTTLEKQQEQKLNDCRDFLRMIINSYKVVNKDEDCKPILMAIQMDAKKTFDIINKQ